MFETHVSRLPYPSFVAKGAAVVLDPEVVEPSKWKGKVKLQFVADGTSAHVSKSKVSVLWSNTNSTAAPTVLVVDDTDRFRRLARTEVRAGDTVVEIGASFGKTSTFLRAALSSCVDEDVRSQQSKLLAIDVSEQACEAAKRLLEADGARLLGSGGLEGLCPAEVVCADVFKGLKPIDEGKQERRRLKREGKGKGNGAAGSAADDASAAVPVSTDVSEQPEEEGKGAGNTMSGLGCVVAARPNKLFIDLGLKRPLHTLMQLLDRLLPNHQKAVRVTATTLVSNLSLPMLLPQLVVVKSAPLLAELKRNHYRLQDLWSALPRTAAASVGIAGKDAENGGAAAATMAPFEPRARDGSMRKVAALPDDFRRFCRPSWTKVLGGKGHTNSTIASALLPHVPDARRAKIQAVAAKRIPWIVCVLERLYDLGNIAAVMRSAEAFGIGAVYLVGQPTDKVKPTKSQGRVSVGAEKWLDV